MLSRNFWLVVVSAAAVLAFTGTGFASGLSGNQTSSTATSAIAIGTYTVTNVAYILNEARPARVDAITFTIVNPGAQPSIVRAQPVANGTFYYCDTAPSGANYLASCPTDSPQWTLADGLPNMTSLTIVIRE